MKNILKKVSIFIVMVILVGMFSAFAIPTAAASGSTYSSNPTIAARIDKVLANYGPNTFFTKNGKACSCHASSSINCVNSPSNCNCLRKVNIDGKTVDLLGVQCMGYARYWQQILFGSHEKNSSNFKKISGVSGNLTAANTKTWFTNNKASLHPGTHMRVYYEGHSIILLNVDYEQGNVTYIQSNWVNQSTNNGTWCKVSTITTKTWSGFASTFTTINYAQVYKNYYTEYPDGAKTNELTINYNANGGVIGDTYKIIESDGLKIRSGPGTSYDRLGAYALNSTFIVTEYKQMSDYNWGKVYYDGQYGWVALNSEWVKRIDSTYCISSSMIYKNGESSAFAQVLPYGVVKDTGLYNTTTFGLYREGYNFVGWSTSPTGDATIFSMHQSLRPEEIVPELVNGDKSVTLYAIWQGTESQNNYSVSYDANGGTDAPETQIKVQGKNLTLSSETPTRSNYIFMGWSSDKTDTVATYNPGDTYYNDADIVLYAIWKPDTWEMELHSQWSVTISAGEMDFYSFTPNESGRYVIYSFDSGDTVVHLYDADFNEIAMDDDGGDDFNFRLEYDYIAGETYIFGIEFWDTSVTAYVSFSLTNIYTISYDANGGEYAPETQIKDGGEHITIDSTIPYRDGYVFVGWSTNSNDTTAMYYPGSVYFENEDVVLYAVWAKADYTIKYDPNGGFNAPLSQTKYYGEVTYLSSQKPTRIGYDFLGWSTDSTATYAEYYEGESYYEDEDVIFYAVWRWSAEEFQSEYSMWTSNAGSPTYIAFTPLVSGNYVFYSNTSNDVLVSLYDSDLNIIGSDDDSGTDRNFRLESYLDAGEKYIYAVDFFDKSQTGELEVILGPVYTISYDGNGGYYVPESQNKDYGVDLKLDDFVPYRDGYEFLGWSTSNDTSVEYYAGSTYSTNAGTTLYAVWTANEYIVTFDANGGTNAPAAQTKVHDTALTLSTTVPTKSGYSFAGWKANDGTIYQAGSVYTANAGTTLYAVWTANEYTVAFDANGGTNAPAAQTKVHDVSLTLSSTVPTKVGYSFAGWKANDGTIYQAGSAYTANAGTTLYAVWTANEYTVTFDANGGTNAPAVQTKVHDVSLTLSSTIPTKTGYSFAGWATSANATSVLYQSGADYINNESVVLYAVWKENTIILPGDSTDSTDKDNVVDTEASNKETVDNNQTDKNDATEKKEESGCNSSIAISGLLVVTVFGAAIVCKKKKED